MKNGIPLCVDKPYERVLRGHGNALQFLALVDGFKAKAID